MGSITLFVLIAIIFFLVMTTSIYFGLFYKNTSISKKIQEIQKQYQIGNIDEVYNETLNNLNQKFSVTLYKENGEIYNIDNWTNNTLKLKITYPITVPEEERYYFVDGVRKKYTGNEEIDANCKIEIECEGNKKELNITKIDKGLPLASIYEDYDEVNRKARISVDVADYESDVDYVELPNGTKQTIYDELKNNVKVLILEEITNNRNDMPNYESTIRQNFDNVTVNDGSITASNIGNTDYDIVFSNANVWESTKQDILKAAFDAGKSVITLGNDSTNKLNIIENTIAAIDPIPTIAGKNQLVENEITPKINFNKANYTDAQHIITQLINEAETWYTLEWNGKEYPAIAYYESKDARWFHSQMAHVSFKTVMPYLIRKLTRISTASYEITQPGTYTFKIYDKAGNCTEKTITTGNYKVTYDYNERILANADFKNGLTNWWCSNTDLTATMDAAVTYKGNPTVRLHTTSNGTWNGFNNGTLTGFYPNTLYKMHVIAYKDDNSSYGLYRNNFRAYIPEATSDGTRVDTGQLSHFIFAGDKVWTTFETEFTTKGANWANVYMPFEGHTIQESTIWIAEVRVERIQNQSVAYGNTLGTLPTITKNGATFLGWYTEKTGGTQIKATNQVEAKNVTYYAHWK